MRRPELYAGDVFQTLARAKGLVLPAPEVGYAAPSGAEIAGRTVRAEQARERTIEGD